MTRIPKNTLIMTGKRIFPLMVLGDSKILSTMLKVKNSYIGINYKILRILAEGKNQVPIMAYLYISPTTADIPKCLDNDRKYKKKPYNDIYIYGPDKDCRFRNNSITNLENIEIFDHMKQKLCTGIY